MKILIVTLGSIGDLLPFLAVAEALRDRGHDVVFASNAGYAALIARAGFEFAAIWDRAPSSTLDDMIENNPQAAWETVRREMFVPATEPAYDFIAHFARAGKCVVLASWSAFGAALAHAKLGVPLCSVYLSPHALCEKSVAQGDGGAVPVGFFPEWFSPPEPGWPPDVRLTGFPMFDDALVPALPAELERFLRAGPPPVIFTPGSFMRRAQGFFRESLAACETLGLRAIFLTPHRDQIPATLPSTVLHFKYAPLQRLARHAAALVYHGGIGTCAQAMRAGIPQLVAPVFFDQFDNARCVEALGIGKILTGYDRDGVAKGLNYLLHSKAVKHACADVAVRFRGQNPAGEICGIVEAMGH